MKKYVETFVVILFLLVVTISSEIGAVKADSTVYIRRNGWIEGTDKIQRDRNVYTLTGDISGTIYVQKTGIVLDGAGYTLKGKGKGSGIDLNNGRESDSTQQRIVDVVVKNFRITNFRFGINTASANNYTIIGNYIEKCTVAITMRDGDCVIKQNTINNAEGGKSIKFGSFLDSATGNKTFVENNFYNFSLSLVLLAEAYFDSNYWSHYDAPDKDKDGIRDTPYVVYERDDRMMGTFEFVDEHPRTTPVANAPIIPEFPVVAVVAFFVVCSLFVFYNKVKLQKLENA